MVFQYKFSDEVTAEELMDLMKEMESAVGDRFPAKNVFHYSLRDLAREKESLKNCISVTSRTDEGKLVGYLRIITDHVYIYYILDVMVAPSVRGQGIGKQLVALATDACKENGFIKIFLTSIPGKESFYEKFGYKPAMSPVMSLRGEDYISEDEL